MGIERYEDSVFINCPFDEAYRIIFNAIVFAVQDSGFLARSAQEIDDSGEVRITKIKRIISECRQGIHDLSRTEPDSDSGLPRFNMPLELGFFLGAKEYGGRAQKQKRTLILDVDRFRFQRFCSDIAGQDIKAHRADPDKAIAAVRNWLASFRLGVFLPGSARMRDRYRQFLDDLPLICAPLYLNPDTLLFVELRTLIQEWTDQHPV
jgi:hypothetical protein